MGRDLNIGLVLQENRLQWTAVQRTKVKSAPADGGGVDLPSALPGAGEEDRKIIQAERAAKLKTACHRVRGFVSAALPSQHVLLRVVELPTIVDSELGDMVELQVDKFSPFPLDSLTVSHEVLVRKTESTVVLLAACQSAMVDQLEKSLTGAGVQCSRIDVAILGWCRLLKDAGEVPEKGRHLAVIMDGGTPEIVVFEDGFPRVFRPLTGLEDMTGEDPESELVNEINFSLLSLEIEQGEGVSGSITLWHAHDEPSSLALRLSNALGHKVVVKALSLLPSLSEGIARRAVTRSGMVDLTPPAWRSAEHSRQFKKRVLMLLLGLLGLWLLAVGGLEGWIFFQRMTLKNLTAQRDALAGPAEEVQEMRRRVQMVQRYMNRGDSALEALREVCTLQPAGVELTSFTYRKEEGIKLQGEAPSVNLVYDFKSALDGSRMFREAALQGPRVDRTGRQLFDVDLKLAGGGQ